jgi:hypothetical protein
MKLVPLVGEDCGGMPALALRKYTDQKSVEAIEALAKQAVVRNAIKIHSKGVFGFPTRNILSYIDNTDRSIKGIEGCMTSSTNIGTPTQVAVFPCGAYHGPHPELATGGAGPMLTKVPTAGDWNFGVRIGLGVCLVAIPVFGLGLAVLGVVAGQAGAAVG